MIRSWRRRLGSGIGRAAGFGISIVVLAAVSLVSINAMVIADGPRAWGAIALGQAVGAIFYTLLGYGWAVSGPAAIALASPSSRWREFADSIRVKVALLVPATFFSAAVACAIDWNEAAFSAAGAASFTIVGLNATWYFVGVARPYMLLILETTPRVIGTIVGVLFMWNGYSAIVGLAWLCAGVFAAFLCTAGWVYSTTKRDGAVRLPKRKLRTVLMDQRHGVISATLGTIYFTAPIASVALIAPATQPAFALADKVQRQLSAALSPFVTVLQGWVPRAEGRERQLRSRIAFGFACVAGSCVAIGMYAAAPILFGWLGDQQIIVPWNLTALVAALIGLSFIDQVLGRAILASHQLLGVVSFATVASLVVGFPLVVLGAIWLGGAGAVGGAILGMLVRLVVQLSGYLRKVERPL